MDQWLLDSLQDHLPEHLLRLLHEHLLDSEARIHFLKHQAVDIVQGATDVMSPLLSPFFDRLAQAIYNSPDIVILAFFLLLLVIVVQIMSWVSRAMMFWTRMALRLASWAALAALAAVVWHRGFAATAQDVLDIGGKLLGYAATVKGIWIEEYQRYEAQARSRGQPSGIKFGASRGR